MKKIVFFMAILFALVFASCAKKTNARELKVGATPEPHAAILNLIVEDVAKDGVALKVIEFTDYVTPNEAVESGEIDANYFQHLPYMESFNAEKNYHLVSVLGVHIEPLALYSKKYKSLDELKEGATIAIPNDPTNEGRALLLLQSAGLIELEDKSSLTSVPHNVVKNTKALKFREIEAASLPRVLDDVDCAIINGNYAIPAGLVASRDGLLVEGSDSPYVNVITVKEGMENDSRIKVLLKALQSEKVKKYIAETYPNGEVVSVF